ncbi:hypothetical protein F4818DRAFT_434787 [Hypoxylon cercidicola]|nr:hypothetical protein F4818DRAFT_434787 [Hypoxylon cercidicola]
MCLVRSPEQDRPLKKHKTSRKHIMSHMLPTDDSIAPAVQYHNPRHLHLTKNCPEIYIYPNSSHHITFPVVSYAAADRAKQPLSLPACYLAIAPHSATPFDFEESLAPKDSHRMVVARLSKSKKTAPLSDFKDIEELRAVSIQLEIWDKDESGASARNGNGAANKAGRGSVSNGGVVNGAQGNKGRGKK